MFATVAQLLDPGFVATRTSLDSVVVSSAATACAKTSVWRSTSASVVAGDMRAML